uniref:MIF4G domain-containing protein n=1 Tax=Parastrongyloides trichosuri TaxID=131310 RepID=A0A0N5A648_PARTI
MMLNNTQSDTYYKVQKKLLELVDSKDKPKFEDLVDAINECDDLITFESLLAFNESISGHDEWHVSYLKFLNLRLDFYYFQHSLELRTYWNINYDEDGSVKDKTITKLRRVTQVMDNSIIKLFPGITSVITSLTNANTEEYINKLRQEIIKICSTDKKIFNKVVFRRHGDSFVQQKDETEDECVSKVKTIFASSCNREKELMDFCLTIMIKAGKIIEECYGDLHVVVRKLNELHINSDSMYLIKNAAYSDYSIDEVSQVCEINPDQQYNSTTLQSLRKITQICEVIFAVHKRNYYTQQQLLMELEEKSTSFFGSLKNIK